jgi:hypothetical protein
MSSTCLLCGRSFANDSALAQHVHDSPAHIRSFGCKKCNKSFGSEEALQQHKRDSPGHAVSFLCKRCNRAFKSENSLQHHERDSPAHVKSFDCSECNRPFKNEDALEQHQRYSPAHAKSWDCNDCNRSFKDHEALKQHFRDSPVHANSFGSNDCNDIEEVPHQQQRHDSPLEAESFECAQCNRTFGSKDALLQHVRDSPAHQATPETPLDKFFRSFKTFEYDPSQPPATSYADLQSHMRWRREDPASSEAWELYQAALEGELRLWYGEEDDLAAWHALCHAIGVEPPPSTREKCEQV